MGKRSSKGRGGTDTAADTSDLTRRFVDSPAAVLEETLRTIQMMDREFLPLLDARIAAGTGLPEAGPGWSAEELPLMRRYLSWTFRHRVKALATGKAEAEAIRTHLERYEVGSLRAYLKRHPASPECLAWLLAENRRLTQALATSEAASRAASMKNADPRAFVVESWGARADRGQSKASFARMIAPEVKRRFGVGITADRIARYWLPRA
jgi:hypothetical protein